MAAVRVLVVDDEPGVLTLVSTILTKSGYEVRTATDAKSALEALSAGRRFDLMLCEVAVATTRGPDLLEGIKQRSPHTALLLMSDTRPDELPSYIEFLNKPFLPQDLLVTVERALAAAARSRDDLARDV